VGRKVSGAVLVFLGAVVVGFNAKRWDPVILDLPRGSHGIHALDVIGMALITLGVLVLWVSGKRR
jgi:hypothetical protein